MLPAARPGKRPGPTQAEVQGEPPLLELQADVVSALAFPMEQDPVSLHALEPQRDHVLEGAHELLAEPVQKGASAIEVSNVRFWAERERGREGEEEADTLVTAPAPCPRRPVQRRLLDTRKVSSQREACR